MTTTEIERAPAPPAFETRKRLSLLSAQGGSDAAEWTGRKGPFKTGQAGRSLLADEISAGVSKPEEKTTASG